MINIDYSGVEIDYSKYDMKQKIEEIKNEPAPVFVKDLPNISEMVKLSQKYAKYKNLIVIGNGGSITSSFAFFEALGGTKKLHVINTMEPDFLINIKRLCKPKDTLVMPISKSGNTVGVLEATIAFLNYPMLIVTSDNNGALNGIRKKLKIDFFEHPKVGGRFSGRTSCGLFPAAILGIDIENLNKGAISMYKKCKITVPFEKNPALKLAASLYALDKKGYHEIFIPIYSTRLWGFGNLIVQLIHESSCKEGRGQTVISAVAPESQHHTNQRFFGGKKNMLGLFVTVQNQDDSITKTIVPDKIKNIPLRDGILDDINDIPLEKSLEFEFIGTKRDADNNRIPNIVVTLDKITAHSIGEFLAFWQYLAVYSSYFRNVNPYDQPQVENSKEISFELRRNFHN